MVSARRRRPLYRPAVHARVAPSAVVVPRIATARASGLPNVEPTGAAASCVLLLGASATARAGNMSVSRLTTSIWRMLIGARPANLLVAGVEPVARHSPTQQDRPHGRDRRPCTRVDGDPIPGRLAPARRFSGDDHTRV